ncbi:MAG: hypothetical protein HY602_03165, partial [Parcubacteria group bacterium]|nr:hypothetical protein [Parcubacteria group bacterium]
MPYLIWIDFIVIFLAFLSAYGLRDLGPFRYFLDGIQPFFVYLKVFPIAAAALIFTLGINRLYDEPKLFDRTAKFYELFKS